MASLLRLASTASGCLTRFPRHFHIAPHTAYFSGTPQQLVTKGSSRSVPVSRCRSTTMAASSESVGDNPKDFKYMQLWVSQDGETHIKECKMKDFDLQKYSSLLQFVKSDFDGQPTKMIFTELSVGLTQPLHPCPEVQFVITLSGSWYIETTDGSRYEFQPGEVLFQDDTKNSPAAKQPQHYSGTVGDQPCQQFIVQFNRAPETDNPQPF